MSSSDATTASFLDEYPSVDNRSCQLLGPTALVNILSEAHNRLQDHDRLMTV